MIWNVLIESPTSHRVVPPLISSIHKHRLVIDNTIINAHLERCSEDLAGRLGIAAERKSMYGVLLLG